MAGVGHYDAMHNEESAARNTIRNILTRDFVLGFLALFAFTCGFTTLFPTLPIFFAQLGSNEREIGMLIGVFGIAALVSRLFVGGSLNKVLGKKGHDVRRRLICRHLPCLYSTAPFLALFCRENLSGGRPCVYGHSGLCLYYQRHPACAPGSEHRLLPSGA
jgi:MFS family permease